MKRLLFHLACILTLFPSSAAWARHTILVNKWNNTLNYYETGKPTRRFRVATGLYKCTPEGRFRIIQKSFISRSGRGQFGTRWLGLNTLGKRGWYRIGIHGTNEPQTIGKHASKACVRMRNTDINWLFDRVPYGTTVGIVDVPIKPKPIAAKPPRLPWLRRLQPPLFSLNDWLLPSRTQALSSSPFATIFWPASTRSPALPTLAYQQPLFAALNRKPAAWPISYTYSHTNVWR